MTKDPADISSGVSLPPLKWLRDAKVENGRTRYIDSLGGKPMLTSMNLQCRQSAGAFDRRTGLDVLPGPRKEHSARALRGSRLARV